MHDSDDTIELDPTEVAQYGRPSRQRRVFLILAAVITGIALFIGGAAVAYSRDRSTINRYDQWIADANATTAAATEALTSVKDERDKALTDLAAMTAARDAAIAERNAARAVPRPTVTATPAPAPTVTVTPAPANPEPSNNGNGDEKGDGKGNDNGKGNDDKG